MRHVNGSAIVGEVAVLHIGQGDSGRLGGVGPIAQSFVSTEIKELIRDDFSTGGGTELIALEGWLRTRRNSRVDVGEEVFRVQGAISQEVVGRSMELVCAALSDRVDLSGAAAKLCRIRICLHF